MKASERHKLKHDKAADTLALGVEWAREHQRPLLVSLAIILFACACMVWFTLSKQSNEETAAALLAIAESKAQIISYMREDTDEKTVREAVTAYDVIAKDYPQTEAAPLAVLSAGQVLMQTGRAEEATAFFRRVLEMAPNQAGMVMLARRGLAESLEGSDNLDEAIANYSVLLENTNTDATAQIHWDIGRCYARLGQTEKAAENLNKVITIAPDSAWARLAQYGIENPEALSHEPSTESAEVPTPGINVSVTPPLPEEPESPDIE